MGGWSRAFVILMARYRNYSDDDKAEVLAYFDACNNQRMAARDYKIPLRTLQRWIEQRDKQAEGIETSAPDANVVAEKKADLADKLEALAHKLVDAAHGKIEDAYLQPTMTSAAIAIDKMRLLRDEPTSITQEMLPKTVEERDAKLAEIVERVKLRVVNGTG